MLYGVDPRSAACKLYDELNNKRAQFEEYHKDELKMRMDWFYSMPWLLYEGVRSIHRVEIKPWIVWVSNNILQYSEVPLTTIFLDSDLSMSCLWPVAWLVGRQLVSQNSI